MCVCTCVCARAPVCMLSRSSHVQLCDPMDCSLHPWNFPGENTGVGWHFLLQGIFLTQVLNPLLLHWQVDVFATESPRKPVLSLGDMHILKKVGLIIIRQGFLPFAKNCKQVGT